MNTIYLHIFNIMRSKYQQQIIFNMPLKADQKNVLLMPQNYTLKNG